MKKFIKSLYPLSLVALVAITLVSTNCKLSFAKERENSQQSSVSIGRTEKPNIQQSGKYSQFKSIFADIAEEAIPTVVTITSTKIDTIVYTNPFYQFFGSPFDEFFGYGTPQRRGIPKAQRKERRESGIGSGVIVSKEGYILTNNHVIEGADEITVTLTDDREFEAEIIGRDSLSDVAVIKLKGDVKNLPVAYIGDSDKLRPGDWVMAVGNPFNLSSTVTTGIVSAKGRHTSGISTYQNFIQTDAAINPGNSGGALMNIEGELIGINTMIYTRSGGYMGIGFAIPINMAKNIMNQLIKKGKVERGWLGVQIGDMDQSMRAALGLGNKKGVLVNDVFKNQPAEKAGVKSGDVILSINGIHTKDANSLRNTVAGIEPGKKVPMKVFRDGKEITLSVKLETRDEEKIGKLETSKSSASGKPKEINLNKKLGFKIGDLTPELRNRLSLEADTKGIIILSVDKNSKAAMKGIREYDIIHKVKTSQNGMVTVNNTKQFKNAIKSIASGDSILLQIERNGNFFFVAFKVR